MSRQQELIDLKNDTDETIPRMILEWLDKNKKILKLRNVEEEDDLKGKSTPFCIPLVDASFEVVESTVFGRTSENNAYLAARGRGTQNALSCIDGWEKDGCSARRLYKYGESYAPLLAFLVHIYTNDEELESALKTFFRILCGDSTSYRHDEGLKILEPVYQQLKKHLLLFSPLFPPRMVDYIESWTSNTMYSDWNLYVQQKMLFIPDPEQQILVPTQLLTRIRDYYDGGVFEMDILSGIDEAIEAAELLKSKFMLQEGGKIGEIDNKLWGSGQYRFSKKQQKLIDLKNKIDSTIPRMILEWIDEKRTLKFRKAEAKDDLEGKSTPFCIPLVDASFEVVESTVFGRTNQNNAYFAARDRGNKNALSCVESWEKEGCSARRLYKYGESYAPLLAFLVHIYTNDEELESALKTFCRILCGDSTSVRHDEGLKILEPVYQQLKKHLLLFSPLFPPRMVDYIESWTSNTMYSDWNLYAQQKMLFIPNPEQQILVPTQLAYDIRDFLECDEFGVEFLSGINHTIEAAEVLKSKFILREGGKTGYLDNKLWTLHECDIPDNSLLLTQNSVPRLIKKLSYTISPNSLDNENSPTTTNMKSVVKSFREMPALRSNNAAEDNFQFRREKYDNNVEMVKMGALLVDSGIPILQAKTKLNISRKTLRRTLKLNDIPTTKSTAATPIAPQMQKAMDEAERTGKYTEAALKFGVHPSTLWVYCQRKEIKSTHGDVKPTPIIDDNMRSALEHCRAGTSARSAADKFAVSRTTLSYLCHQQGIPLFRAMEGRRKGTYKRAIISSPKNNKKKKFD